MKRIIIAILLLCIAFSGCSSNNMPEESSDKQKTGTIYLYGEKHNNKKNYGIGTGTLAEIL